MVTLKKCYIKISSKIFDTVINISGVSSGNWGHDEFSEIEKK